MYFNYLYFNYFTTLLECHRTLIGMPPFVVAMEEGRYGLWRLRADDDDDDDDDDYHDDDKQH